MNLDSVVSPASVYYSDRGKHPPGEKGQPWDSQAKGQSSGVLMEPEKGSLGVVYRMEEAAPCLAGWHCRLRGLNQGTALLEE